MYRRTHQSFTLMTKLTCMILSLLLIVCAVPTMPVWAEDVSTAVQAGAVSETTATPVPEVEPAAPTTGNAILSAEGVLSTDAISTTSTVTEVTSLREESIKHFKLPDGTYQAVIYADAVHRKDAGGQWQNIDNRLYLSQDSKSNTEAYRTTDGRTSFAKSYTANEEIFSITEDGYAVSVSMISNQLTLEPIVGGELVTQAAGTTAVAPAASTVTVTNAPAKANPRATEWASIEAALESVGGDNGSIVYTNVAPHTDLEYVLQGNDVKENIIVKATSLSYVYRFRLELTGLTATLTDNGSVSLRDATGTERLTIPVPYMYDAAGEVSYAVTYGLATNTDGSYTLTVTADPTWVNDADRVFPVTIDPSIVQRGLIFDTFVSESNPSTNYFDSMDLWVGANTDGSNEYVTLVYASIINQLPSGYRITSAYLDMTYYYYLGTTSGNIFVAAFRILNDWDPATITWNQYEQNIRLDSIVSDGQYLEVDGALLSSPGSVRFDITADVTWWYNGTRENHGLVLKRFGGTKQSVILNACENEIDGRDPTITINYTPEIEEGVYAFENIGNAGLWMDTQYNSVEAGMRIQQYAYSASPTTTFERGGLFKISNVPGTQRYVMRLMTNNHLGVLLTGDKVISYEIPGKDADVPIECTVYLFQQDDGTVMIRPANSSKCITANATTASGSAGAPASYLTSVAATEAGSQAKWRMVKYTGDHASGVYLMREGNAHAGLSITVTPYYWSTYTGVNIPSLYLSSLSTDIASLSWNANTRRATIYIYNEGTISVNCTVKNAEGTSSYTVNNFSINAVLPVEEGVYYIKNAAENVYMQLNIQGPLLGGSSGILAGSFSSEDYAKWELTHVAYGLYVIKSVQNGNVLTVDTSQMSLEGEQVRHESDVNSLGQKWKITRTARGTVVIKPYWDLIEELNGCIAIQGGSLTEPGQVVHQYYSDDTSYLDEWHCDSVLTWLPQASFVEEGTYYFLNAANKYLTPSSTVTTVNVQQWSYIYSKNQAFDIIYENGYYRIKNIVSNTYLTAPVIASGNITLETVLSGQGAARQRWQFFEREGAYLIKAQCNSVEVLSCNTTSASNGADVVQGISGDGSVTEWTLLPWENIHEDAFLTYGLTTPSVTILMDAATSTDGTWASIIRNAATAWNDSGSGATVNIISDGTSNHTISAEYRTEDWYGLCTQWPIDGATYKSHITLNTRTLTAEMGQSTAVHEMGHLFSLADNPSATTSTIMNYYRDRTLMIVPQLYDIYNVLNHYD